MSTFNGLVKEFPDIRIDYFRTHPGHRPPSACFLSHVHSDHLQGLENLKMPFVYCSAATKRLLLRLEKYPHRINFAKGILEARKQHYRHLKYVLRALPLNTSVEVELDLDKKIQVTLFDANHCPGAVMFLIQEGQKAVLYTGDIRAESWWVNSLIQNPIFLPYSCGLKTLDCVYLDTTFASRSDTCEYFPPKANGLKELLQKVDRYGQEKVFYFRAWTLGYENVWLALANHLQSQIHVDEYQLRLFRSLGDELASEWQALTGFVVGNHEQPGVLTLDEVVRIHSCEPGSRCHAALLTNPNVVWITPIISRLKNGTEVRELGAGGGGGDLYQLFTLETPDSAVLDGLRKRCADMEMDRDTTTRFMKTIEQVLKSSNHDISLLDLGLAETSDIPLKEFVEAVTDRAKGLQTVAMYLGKRRALANTSSQEIIHFPFSRHSSYHELRHLISVLKPRDICPCTTDIERWSEDLSMQSLFGDLCSASQFEHDQISKLAAEAFKDAEDNVRSSSRSKNRKKRRRDDLDEDSAGTTDDEEYRSAYTNVVENSSQLLQALESQESVLSCLYPSPEDAGLSAVRHEAFKAAQVCLTEGNDMAWKDMGIRSIRQADHTEIEPEL